MIDVATLPTVEASAPPSICLVKSSSRLLTVSSAVSAALAAAGAPLAIRCMIETRALEPNSITLPAMAFSSGRSSAAMRLARNCVSMRSLSMPGSSAVSVRLRCSPFSATTRLQTARYAVTFSPMALVVAMRPSSTILARAKSIVSLVRPAASSAAFSALSPPSAMNVATLARRSSRVRSISRLASDSPRRISSCSNATPSRNKAPYDASAPPTNSARRTAKPNNTLVRMVKFASTAASLHSYRCLPRA